MDSKHQEAKIAKNEKNAKNKIIQKLVLYLLHMK